jgi:hypothetical protein
MTTHFPELFMAAALVLGFPVVAAAQTITFAEAAVGSTPKAFEYELTGGGTAVKWEIIADETAAGGKAMAQTSKDSTDYRFPLAIYAPTVLGNVEVTVRFKPVAGRVDQAGGIFVRFADRNNYYVARANALENNIRFYRVVNGSRQQLGSANVDVKSGEWRTLTLRADGENFAISSDGQQLFAVTDKTFSAPGKVGLWTKADSVTSFDRIEIKTLP